MVCPGQGFFGIMANFRISPITLSLDFEPSPSKKWGIRMRGDPLALQIKGHTKTQRAQSDIFRSLFPSLKILLTPLYSIIKITRWSRLCVLVFGGGKL